MSRPLPGRYHAKVDDYSLVENDKGDLLVVIRFKWGEGETEQSWAWQGGLSSDKAKERTIKTLLTLGLSNDNLELLCEGKTSGLLDTETYFEIVLDETEYDGKKRLQISFVNKIGGSFGKPLTKETAKSKLASLNIKADLFSRGFAAKKTAPEIPF